MNKISMDASYYKNQMQIERDLYKATLKTVLETTDDKEVFKTAESKVGAIRNCVNSTLNINI